MACLTLHSPLCDVFCAISASVLWRQAEEFPFVGKLFPLSCKSTGPMILCCAVSIFLPYNLSLSAQDLRSSKAALKKVNPFKSPDLLGLTQITSELPVINQLM